MKETELEQPIMVAVWPGMGQVAITAGYYLMAKLEMEMIVEFAASELFDVDHVSVNQGLVQPFRYPKSQFFGWKNPGDGPDLVVFIGEAQPPHGRYNFCCKLINYAQRLDVSRIFTFASMASTITMDDPGRVVAAAIDHTTLGQLVEHQIAFLGGGNISGMNGVLLGVAAERHMSGGCLLGEMPHMLAGVPYPKASLNVLRVFAGLTNLEIDLTELSLEADRIQNHLTEAISQLQNLGQKQARLPENEEEAFLPHPTEAGKLSPEEMETLERLFEEALQDRSKAYELKRELDRLDVFREFEDRFLDLFKQDGPGFDDVSAGPDDESTGPAEPSADD